MKTLILSIAIFASSFVASAAESPITLFEASKTIVVHLKDMTRSQAELTIKDENGYIVYSSTIAPKTEKRSFDLSNLPTGNYTLIIENAIEIIEQDILVKEDKAILDAAVEETFKPSVRLNNNLLSVNYLALGNATALTILDQAGVELYKEVFNNEQTIKRQISLVNQLAGTYKVMITTNDDTFITSVKK